MLGEAVVKQKLGSVTLSNLSWLLPCDFAVLRIPWFWMALVFHRLLAIANNF